MHQHVLPASVLTLLWKCIFIHSFFFSIGNKAFPESHYSLSRRGRAVSACGREFFINLSCFLSLPGLLDPFLLLHSRRNWFLFVNSFEDLKTFVCVCVCVCVCERKKNESHSCCNRQQVPCLFNSASLFCYSTLNKTVVIIYNGY